MKKIMLVIGGCIVGMLVFTGCTSAGVNIETAEPVDTVEKVEPEEDVDLPSEIFDVVTCGLKNVDVVENGSMTIIRATTADSRELSVSATLENGELIYIMVSKIPSTSKKMTIGENGKLKSSTEYGYSSVDLFSDTEGGYLAKYDSEAGTITDYETGEVIVKWE